MAVEIALGPKFSLPAAADLSTHQYKFITMNTSGQAALTGAGLAADGILQDKPAAVGRAGEIAGGGISKIVAGTGGITVGALVASGANGTAVIAATGNIVLGRCYEAAIATGIGSIIFYGGGGRAQP